MIGTNNGQRLLVETGESLTKIARACRAGTATVRGWKSGVNLPRMRARKALYKAYGIHPNEWEVALPAGFQIKEPPPNKPGRPRKVKADGEPKPKSAPAPTPAPKVQAPIPRRVPPYPPEPKNATTLQRVEHSLSCIAHDLRHGELTIAARSKLRSDEARTITLLSKLEREHELSEDRYVKNHPAFKAHCKKVLEALKPFPDAAQAVIDALG